MIQSALGLLVAVGSLQGLTALLGEQLPRAAEVGINARALLFNLAVSLVAGIGFGLAPALQLSTRRIHQTLRSDTRS